MKTDLIRGGCLCGAVRYEASGEPYHITHCHCEDCRKSSAAPFVTWASFRREDFRFTAGEPREFAWAGRLRWFCDQCGTPLIFMSRADAPEVDVTVCSFDQPEGIVPSDNTWVADRLPWTNLASTLPGHDQARSKT